MSISICRRGFLTMMGITAIMLLMVPSCRGRSGSTTRDLIPHESLYHLNSLISHSSEAQSPRLELFDSLRREFNTSGDERRRWEAANRLGIEMRQTNADTAMKYANWAFHNMPEGLDADTRLQTHLNFINAQSTAGLFLPAHFALDSIEHTLQNDRQRIEYFKAMRMHCSYMNAYLHESESSSAYHSRQYLECDDSLIALLPEGDNFRDFILAERLVTNGKWQEASKQLAALMQRLPKESNIYGMAAFQMGETCKHLGDYQGYAHNLTLAAESDIRGAVKEGIALPTLADWLFKHGDLDDAFRYINYAMADANDANVRMRTVFIASMLPMIDEAYRTKMTSSQNMMTGYLLTAVVLLLIAVGLLVLFIKNTRKLRANERNIASASRILESYIGNFISLCSNYAARLEQLSKLVTRKINAGQSEDLLKMIAQGKLSQADNDDFYKLIDKALLDIFPDLIDNVNTLLQPDKHIELKEGELLTPELRICGFMRLGVSQSARIAQILNYSVNTVYAYRNRLRNRAINRDSFDDELMSLGKKLSDDLFEMGS